MSYRIFTDATSDLPASFAQDLNVTVLPMGFSMEGKEYLYVPGKSDMSIETFFANMRAGIDVILDESTHLPHDSGAYRRSRQTAERLLQKGPDAIIDIHRDGIPDQNEYACSIDGEPTTDTL